MTINSSILESVFIANIISFRLLNNPGKCYLDAIEVFMIKRNLIYKKKSYLKLCFVFLFVNKLFLF